MDHRAYFSQIQSLVEVPQGHDQRRPCPTAGLPLPQYGCQLGWSSSEQAAQAQAAPEGWAAAGTHLRDLQHRTPVQVKRRGVGYAE